MDVVVSPSFTTAITNTIVVDYAVTAKSCIGVVQSHDDTHIPCIKMQYFTQYDFDQVTTIYINEAQFFTGLYTFVTASIAQGKHIHIYGLDGDYKQDVFGEILQLIPKCDSYIKLYATCACKQRAPFSKRLSTSTVQYLPHDTYVPVCRNCLYTSS